MKLTINRWSRTVRGLLRLPTYSLMLLYLLAGAFAARALAGVDLPQGHWPAPVVELLAAAVVIGLFYIYVTGLNDWADYDIDRINLADQPDRPLVAGLTSRAELLTIATVAGLAATALAWWLAGGLVWLLVGLLVGGWAYSLPPIRVSHRGGWAPALLPFCYVVLPLSLGLVLAGWPAATDVWWLYGGLYLQFSARLLLKDYRDVAGDSAHGKRTFLLRRGNRAVVLASGWALIGGGTALLAVFGGRLGPFSLALAACGLAGLGCLKQLSLADDYRRQKVWLTVFGRLMSGLTVAVIFGLAAEVYQLSQLQTWLLAGLATAIFLASAVRVWQIQQARAG